MTTEHQQSDETGVTLAPCAEPPDEEIRPGDYHYFNGLTHCSGEHAPLPTNPAAERLGHALQEINETAVVGEFKVGAAYALGVLAALAEAGPGSTWMDVAHALVAPITPPGGEH